MPSLSAWRAWVEIMIRLFYLPKNKSLSAWRAWVEIACGGILRCHMTVALRMESVGRNLEEAEHLKAVNPASLSAWRAWVEILKLQSSITISLVVALRMESVGRNPFSGFFPVV